MCFYGSKLSLSAIYKNVNSKLYLLRMSSFLIYIYTMVHLIYFFYMVLNTLTYFAVHDIFYPVLMDLFFHAVFSGLDYRLNLTK